MDIERTKSHKALKTMRRSLGAIAKQRRSLSDYKIITLVLCREWIAGRQGHEQSDWVRDTAAV